MAVQIARIGSGPLHIDTGAIRKILDKVGAHPVTVIAASWPLQTVSKAIAEDSNCYQPEMVRGHGKSEAGILMWPEPLMVSHNGQNSAVLLMTVDGTLDSTMEKVLISAIGCPISGLSSGLNHHVKNGFAEDMLQGVDLQKWILGHECNISKTKTLAGKKMTDNKLKALAQKSLMMSKIPISKTNAEMPIAVALNFFWIEMTSVINGHNGQGSLSSDQVLAIYANKKQEALTMFEHLTMAMPKEVQQEQVDILKVHFDECVRTFLQMNAEKRRHLLSPFPEQVHVRMEDTVLARKQRHQVRQKEYRKCFILCFVGLVTVTAVFLIVWSTCFNC